MTTALGDVSLAIPAESAPRARRGGMLRKGFWAVMDQGLFAGSNFIVNIMLANWLTPAQYGAFSTAFAAFLFLGVVHTALLTEPMLVFAPDRYKSQMGKYFAALIRGHVIVSLAASACLAIAGLYLRAHAQIDLANALFWFAATGPFTLFLWFMRRTSYAQFNPRRAAMAGFVYLFLIVAGLLVFHHIGVMGVGVSLVLMGACSLVAGLWLVVGHVHFGSLDSALLKDVAAEHWKYGRWAAATQLLGYIPGNVYYFLLPKLATLEQSGALRALSNLVNPFIQANAALCLLLLPAFVRSHHTPEGKRMHRLALLVLAGAPAIYWLGLGIFNHQIIALVYKGKYAQYSSLLWVIGLQPVIAGMCGVYGSLLRARQKLNAVFWGGVVAAVAAVTLGVWLTLRWGMAGVCWSIIITYALHHITLWLFSLDWSGPRVARLPFGIIGRFCRATAQKSGNACLPE